MSIEASGQGGAGACTVYTITDAAEQTLEVLTFKVVGSASGNGHMVRLLATSPAGGIVWRLDDLNVGGDSQTNFYTYGLGLNASACTLPTGLAVTDALPWTDLLEGTTLQIIPIDNAGATIAGDVISDVFLRFADTPASQPPVAAFPLTLLPGAAAA